MTTAFADNHRAHPYLISILSFLLEHLSFSPVSPPKLHESEAAADNGVREAVATMKKYSGEQKLTKEIVDVFIDRILIYDPRHIEIHWKLPDELIKFIEG